jgi:hypothetical protein
MSLGETLALIGLMWFATGSVIALLVCRRWRNESRREHYRLTADPMSLSGIERGDKWHS